MEARTYQATTMAQALADVKRNLGRDAVILNTRRCRKGGLLGLIGGRRVWEVQAASHMALADHPAGLYVPTPPADAEAAGHAAPAASEPAVNDTAAATLDIQAPPEAAPRRATHMAAEMSEIRRMVETLVLRQVDDGDALSEPLRAIRHRLIEQELDANLADGLISELRQSLQNQPMPEESVLLGRMTDLISRRIRTAAPGGVCGFGRPCVIALIGPTGVGKTTTIAKMAANLKLREHKNVALVTIDTYRIAAVDQLRTYAEIIDVPLHAAMTPGELQACLRGMGDKDVVLIDTAGRSQNDQPRLKELRQFIEAAEADEVHLVVSASSNGKAARAACQRFAPMGADRIIMTKLDEAATFGMILNIAAATDAAVSFITTGQDVPDDIRSADANLLAQCVVKGSWHES